MNFAHALRGAGFAGIAVLSTLLLPVHPAGATSKLVPVVGIASVTPSGAAGAGGGANPSVTNGGRFLAFDSTGKDLVAGDGNGVHDVFVRDTLAATTVMASVSTKGVPGNQASGSQAISGNGRYVVFRSEATNLVPGDTNGVADIFVRDLVLKTTTRVSLPNNGTGQLVGGESSAPTITDDGTQVAFQSSAINAVDFDLNNQPDAFVRNRVTNKTEIVSLTSNEAGLTQGALQPSISSTGAYVVFDSTTAQIGVDTNAAFDVFLRDRAAGSTERVSLAFDGKQAAGPSRHGTVSSNGRYVAFESAGAKLSGQADAAGLDVFRRDRNAASTVLVNLKPNGTPSAGNAEDPSISADGSKISFMSGANDLVAGDTNNTLDTFVRNVSTSSTSRSSTTATGGQVLGASLAPSLSADGATSAFMNQGTSLFAKDTNGGFDTFWRGTYELGPFAAATGLVQQNSLGFNGVSLTAPQEAAAVNRIAFGVASPESTINAMAHGTFDDHRGPVIRLYWSFFHRIPDAGGLNYWVKKNTTGTNLNTIADSFAKSSEFTTAYGSLSNDAFVKLVYGNVLGRSPDAAGLAHWIAQLKTGTSRGNLMVKFSESSEGKRTMRGEVDTILVVSGMLHKMPAKSLFDTYVYLLENKGGAPTEVMVRMVLQSGAYAATID